MKDQIRWGILGLGAIASEFVHAHAGTGKIQAVASRSAEKAADFAAVHQIPIAHGDYLSLMQDPRIDAVYIATPHNSHAQWIQACLSHGKHVLCEKAITVNSRQLDACCTLAQQKGLVLEEAMTIYHMPLYQELLKRIQTGAIGRLRMIQIAFGSLKEPSATNRYFNPDLAGGALLDIGVYALSLARMFLTEQPTEVTTLMTPYPTGVDDASGILMKNTRGELASITLTMRAKAPKRAVIAGEEGYFLIDNYPRADTAYAVDGATGAVENIHLGDSARALLYETEYMEQKIQFGSNQDALRMTRDVMSLITQIQDLWRQKKI